MINYYIHFINIERDREKKKTSTESSDSLWSDYDFAGSVAGAI